MSAYTRPIGILYEHPLWFNPLFKELEKRRIPFVRIQAANHQYNPAERDVPYSLVLNRVSSSAYKRGNYQGIVHSANYLAHVERLGIPVINGTAAQHLESSKAQQVELLASLGYRFPKTRIVNHISQLIPAARSMRFPVVVKVTMAGSASDIVRFSTFRNLEKAIHANQLQVGIDHTAVVQEFIPAKENHIVRVETLNGKYLYAVKIHTKKDSFNLRPDEQREGVETSQRLPKNGIRLEAYTPPDQIIQEVERIAKTARLDSGAVEYVVSATDDQVYYCNVIAQSNFVPDAVEVLGFDPHVAFVDYIEKRLSPVYEIEPELDL